MNGKRSLTTCGGLGVETAAHRLLLHVLGLCVSQSFVDGFLLHRKLLLVALLQGGQLRLQLRRADVAGLRAQLLLQLL